MQLGALRNPMEARSARTLHAARPWGTGLMPVSAGRPYMEARQTRDYRTAF